MSCVLTKYRHLSLTAFMPPADHTLSPVISRLEHAPCPTLLLRPVSSCTSIYLIAACTDQQKWYLAFELASLLLRRVTTV